jgi:hypothetical protein
MFQAGAAAFPAAVAYLPYGVMVMPPLGALAHPPRSGGVLPSASLMVPTVPMVPPWQPQLPLAARSAMAPVSILRASQLPVSSPLSSSSMTPGDQAKLLSSGTGLKQSVVGPPFFITQPGGGLAAPALPEVLACGPQLATQAEDTASREGAESPSENSYSHRQHL